MTTSKHTVLGVLATAYLLCYAARMMMASAIPFIAREFDLDPLAMGGLLSAFFLGYAVMQIPGGFLADRFGPRRMLLATVVGWSVLTALTGVATSLAGLIVIRVLFGASEGPFPSAAAKTLSSWFPAGELGRANGLMLAATQIGASLAPSIVAILVVAWGWRSAFIGLLVPGLALAVVIWACVGDYASKSRRHAPASEDRQSVADIFAALRRPAVAWCFVAAFFSNLATWGLMNWLPTYLLESRGFSATRMGLLAAVPSLAGALGYALGGVISDKWFERRRQIPIIVGLVLSAGCVYLAASAASGEATVAYLAAAFFFLLATDLGVCTLPLVIVPREAVGSSFGVINTAAQLAGFVSPLLVGGLLRLTERDFAVVFQCFVGFLLLAALAAAFVRQREPTTLRMMSMN